MINTELFSPGNFIRVAVMGIAAYLIFNHFTKKAA